jgi:hypothetical protein
MKLKFGTCSSDSIIQIAVSTEGETRNLSVQTHIISWQHKSGVNHATHHQAFSNLQQGDEI